MYINIRKSHKGRASGYVDIAEAMKNAIIRGQYGSGERLPTRRELIGKFHSTPVTVQRAMRLLQTQGFLRAQRRNGTFVVDHPPHVSRIALAFCIPPWDATSRFYKAIAAEAEKIQRPDRTIAAYYQVAANGRDYRSLLLAARSRTVAGIIFTFAPFLLADTPLLKARLPMVFVQTPVGDCEFPQIYPDTDGFLSRALERLANHGRRNPALLTLANEGTLDEAILKWNGLCAKYGLRPRAEWIQGVSAHAASWARQTVLAMFGPGHRDLPDSLVISDDNLVEPATRGLAETGLKIPDRVEVISHANFPWPTKAFVPNSRLGYDMRELVEQCMESIEQQRCGCKPKSRLIPARFAEELPAERRGIES